MSCISKEKLETFFFPLLVHPFHPFTTAREVHVTARVSVREGQKRGISGGKKTLTLYLVPFPTYSFFSKIPLQKQGWQQPPKKSTCAHLDRIPSSQSRAVSIVTRGRGEKRKEKKEQSYW